MVIWPLVQDCLDMVIWPPVLDRLDMVIWPLVLDRLDVVIWPWCRTDGLSGHLIRFSKSAPRCRSLKASPMQQL